MKKVTKTLLLVLCAVLLVVGSVMGTLAYLQDDDQNVNTFTSGHVYIELTEAEIADDGKTVIDGSRVKANEYELIPGRALTKDPTVTVLADSEESYVFMTVTVDAIADLEAALPDAEYYADGVFLLENLISGWDGAIWEYVGYDSGVYLFKYYDTVSTKDAAAEDLEPLFTTINVPAEDVTNENIEQLASVTITVDAYAIQAEGFTTAQAAWETGFDADQTFAGGIW